MLPRQTDGKYVVRVQDGVVEAWSTVRLPFQPDGWSRDLRAELRYELGNLIAESDEVLHAVYAAAPGSLCDVENVLLYNVGSGAVSSAMTNGVRIERAYNPPPAPVTLEPLGGLHYHRYALARPGEPFAHWVQGTELLRIHRVSFPLAEVAQVWSAIRFQTQPPAAARVPPRKFGLRLAVSPIGNGRGLTIELVKRIIDGVVSALHRYEGTQLDEVAYQLSAKGLGSPAQIAAQLTDDRWALLGPRRVVWPYRDSGVQWNPADDICLAAEVIMDTRPTAHGQWELSGTVFALP